MDESNTSEEPSKFWVKGYLPQGKDYTFYPIGEQKALIVQAYMDAASDLDKSPDDVLRSWIDKLSPEQRASVELSAGRNYRANEPWKDLYTLMQEGGFVRLETNSQ